MATNINAGLISEFFVAAPTEKQPARFMENQKSTHKSKFIGSMYGFMHILARLVKRKLIYELGTISPSPPEVE